MTTGSKKEIIIMRGNKRFQNNFGMLCVSMKDELKFNSVRNLQPRSPYMNT